MRFYKRVDQFNVTTTVESYSHDGPVEGALEIDEIEYDAYIASLPPPPKPYDAKEEWGKALTTEAKLIVVARAFGWD